VRVARVEATPLAIPLEQEFHWSGGVQRGANLVLFSVHTDDGVVGYGESICEDPVAVTSYGLLMAEHFVGQELANVEAMLRSVWTEGRWRFWPQFTQLTVSGIEMACWDALGRTLGVPTNVFFGGRVRDEVDFFGFVQGDSPEQLARHAGELAARGFDVVYVKLGRSARDDEECVAAIRDAIGPERLLRVDPNEAWDVGEAVERIRRLETYGLDWVEQPVPAGNVKGLAHVRRSVGVKIAADQAVFTTRQLLEVLREEAADVVVQGAHDAGGLLPFRQQATIAQAHGVNVNRHAFMETEVSFLANLQVAATIPNLTSGNQVMHQLLAERLVKPPLPLLENGRARVPDLPGHGFEIDLDAVAVAHERWERDGPYPTRELRQREAIT
jgi:L-alanine-DL-glutamate epimerase-like enolase superfamily enzyme